MISELTIKSLKNGRIFQDEFISLAHDNVLRFYGRSNMAIVYAPNGTGKTSLADAFQKKNDAQYEVEIDGTAFDSTSKENVFHIVSDQNSRNIINGDPKEFLLGDNVRREYELKESIDALTESCKTNFAQKLKSEHSISKKNQELYDCVTDQDLLSFVSCLANSRDRGKSYTPERIIEIVDNLHPVDYEEINEDKLFYFKTQYENPSSHLRTLMEIPPEAISQQKRVEEISENADAITILEKYRNKNECIVCDTKNIDPTALIASKTINRRELLATLDQAVRDKVEVLLEMKDAEDTFAIKGTLLQALANGDPAPIKKLQSEINNYRKAFFDNLQRLFLDSPDVSKLRELLRQYNGVRDGKIQISDEDLQLIQTIVDE